MALLHYFQVTASLPTAKETALGDTVTQSANATVLREVQAERPRKCKPYTVFTGEQRATIGKYVSEHGDAAEVKKFKANIEVVSSGKVPFVCSRSATSRSLRRRNIVEPLCLR